MDGPQFVGDSVYLSVSVPQVWRTRDGHRAHITHIHDPRQGHGIRIAGIVEGDPSSHVWDEHGKAIGKSVNPFGLTTSQDGENLDLIEVCKPSNGQPHS